MAGRDDLGGVLLTLICNRPRANCFVICSLGTSVTLITSLVYYFCELFRAKNIKYIRVVIMSNAVLHVHVEVAHVINQLLHVPTGTCRLHVM